MTAKRRLLALSCFVAVAATFPSGETLARKKSKETPFTVWIETDEFNPGVTTVRSSHISIKKATMRDQGAISIEFKYVYSEDLGFASYIATVYYFGGDWVFWDSLSVKVGEEVTRLKLIGQPRREVISSLVLTEQIAFDIPEATFERMASAQRVDFRVNGRYYKDFWLNEIGTSYLRKLAEFIDERTPHAAAAESSNSEAQEVPPPPAEPSALPSYLQELRELAKLRDEGILTEEEFEKKKRQLLNLEEAEKTEAEQQDSSNDGEAPAGDSASVESDTL